MERHINESDTQKLSICTGELYMCINSKYNYADHDCLQCRYHVNIIKSIINTKYELGISVKPLERTWKK